MWEKVGMTRDELIEELKKCPYDSEVEFKIEVPGYQGYEKVTSEDRFRVAQVCGLPGITITIE